MANLATDDGVKTPEQLAAEALEDQIVEIGANHSDNLDIVARYLNKDVLVASRKPESVWEKMKEVWRKDALETLIDAKAKAITDYMDKKEKTNEAFDLLIAHYVSQGMAYTEARKKALGK